MVAERGEVLKMQHFEAKGVNVVVDADAATKLSTIIIRRPNGELLASIVTGPIKANVNITGVWD